MSNQQEELFEQTEGVTQETEAHPSVEVETTADDTASSVEPETVEADDTTETVIAQLEADKEALTDQLLRVQAEIQNMRRIHTRERQDAAKYRSQSLASKLLDVVDNLERALASEATSEDAQALKKGVEMVYNQFLSALEQEQITTIDPVGEPFDPNFHQAVSVMPAPDGEASDTVITVLQKGYQLSERVLRPAMVIVAE